MIEKIVIKNFKTFRDSIITLNPETNILVGSNEAGKSTVLEAVYLGLTGRIGREYISSAISPHHLNRRVAQDYLDIIRKGDTIPPPEILIELYMQESEDTATLRGTNNSLREDCPGVRLRLAFDDSFQEEYEELLKDPEKIRSVPIEYYKPEWTAFSGNAITRRNLMIGASFVDAAKIRLKSGSDYYLQQIIEDSLTPVERVRLARAYVSLKETFAQSEGIATLNTSLNERKGQVTDKILSMLIDISPKAAWESTLVPHLDELPLHHAGGGEQSMMKILLALTRTTQDSHILLVEEPENHLSFLLLNRLLDKISSMLKGRQVILTTHSSYVLNKLGLNQLLLLKNRNVVRMSDLPEGTQLYFKKLPGYDTLRMVLADTVILVEGPSDELIVQRAYRDRYDRLPIQAGIDVISVRGLSFKRFLDIALKLGTKTTVITDNDGEPDQVAKRYEAYLKSDNIRICFSKNAELPSLEPQFVECNTLTSLNKVLGKNFPDKKAVTEYIGRSANKTDAALAIFNTKIQLAMPDYITDAIDE